MNLKRILLLLKPSRLLLSEIKVTKFSFVNLLVLGSLFGTSCGQPVNDSMPADGSLLPQVNIPGPPAALDYLSREHFGQMAAHAVLFSSHSGLELSADGLPFKKGKGTLAKRVQDHILQVTTRPTPVHPGEQVWSALGTGALRWSTQALVGGVGIERKAFESLLTYADKPVFGAQLKWVEAGQVPWVSGSLPPFLGAGVEPEVKEERLESSQVLRSAAAHYGYAIERMSIQSLGYYPRIQGQKYVLEPCYLVNVSASHGLPGKAPFLPFETYVSAFDGEVLQKNTLAFHIDGKAKIYPENSVATPLMSEVSLPGLSGDGSKLESDFIKVVSCGGNQPPSGTCTQSLAQGADWTLSAPAIESAAYDELVAYYAVQRAFSWHQKIQGNEVPLSLKGWGAERPQLGLSASKKLKISVRTLTRGGSQPTCVVLGGECYTPDNATYLPKGFDGGGLPEIVIGTGWEAGQTRTAGMLRYLGKDADVVMHEFGHHIVYRSIKEVSGESGAMHEGFADYFTYAVTGNNKLGESIVSTGLPLRQGNLSGQISSYKNAPIHKAGQFWSSGLWEVRLGLGEWKDGIFKFDKIVWDAIDLIPQNGGYYQAIMALLKSAEFFVKENSGDLTTIKSKIHEVFSARGYITVQGDTVLPSADVNSSGETGVAADPQPSGAKKKSGVFPWCGVVAHGGVAAQATLSPNSIGFFSSGINSKSRIFEVIFLFSGLLVPLLVGLNSRFIPKR